MTKRRIPGTVLTDISEDQKGDHARALPQQPDLFVDDDDGGDGDREPEALTAGAEGGRTGEGTAREAEIRRRDERK